MPNPLTMAGIAGKLHAGAILFSLGALIVRLTYWITRQFEPVDADSRSSS